MKYIGSKQRLSKHIIPIIQSAIGSSSASLYLEPFVGGANVIDKVDAHYKIGTDVSEPLIELLKHIKDGGDIPDTISREEYEAVRSNPEQYAQWYVGLVGFCASYNSKFFGGYANGVKTKIGTVRNYTDEAIKNIKAQAPRLAGTSFFCCDFRWWSDLTGAVIYCDPPYAGVTQYKGEPFDSSDYWEWLRTMGRKNIVIASEYEAPADFSEIAAYSLATTLDKSQKIARVEKLFTIGRGSEIFKGGVTA